MLEKIPNSVYKIRFIDCDPLGHLTNSRYIDYMLNAREDHVQKAYQLDYLQIAQETGGSWVTLQNQIAYLKEVRYGTKVQISSKLIDYSDKRVLVEILMMDAQGEKVHAILWTEAIFFNLQTRKSAKQPENFLAMFEEVKVSLEQKDFKSRVQSIISQG